MVVILIGCDALGKRQPSIHNYPLQYYSELILAPSQTYQSIKY